MATYKLKEVKKIEDISIAHINMAYDVVHVLSDRIDETEGTDDKAVRALAEVIRNINLSYLP